MVMGTRPEFRRIIESYSQYAPLDEHGYPVSLSRAQRIEIGRKKFFDFDYPIFDSEYRKIIETKIIKRFYVRQIGFETAGLFKLMMENWLNEYMPYYNQLYKSELLKYDPLANVGYQDKYSRTNDSNRDSIGNLTNGVTADGTRHETNVGKSTTDATSNTDTTNKATTDTTSDTDTTSNTDTTDKVTTDTNSNTDTTSTEHAEGTENKRVMGDETPQSRLANTEQYGNDVNTTNANSTNDTKGSGSNKTVSTTTANSTINTTETGTNKNVSHGESNDTGSSKTVNHSETDTTDTDDVTTHNTSNQDQNTKANEKFQNTEDYIFHRTGKTSDQTYAKMIIEFRDTFLNIDDQIINQLDGQMFSGLYM